jgi:hypothetical protein
VSSGPPAREGGAADGRAVGVIPSRVIGCTSRPERI